MANFVKEASRAPFHEHYKYDTALGGHIFRHNAHSAHRLATVCIFLTC